MPFVTGLSAPVLKRMLLWCDFFLTAVRESLCVCVHVCLKHLKVS